MLIKIYVDKGPYAPLMRDSYLNTEAISFLVDLSYVRIKYGNKIKKFYRIRFINIEHLHYYYSEMFTYYISKRDFKKLRRKK